VNSPSQKSDLELTRHHGHLNIVRTAALQKGVLGAKGKTAISTSVHKAEAVELVQSSGRSISQIAKDLGVSGTSLRNWVKQAQIDQGEREGLTTEEREELRRLRRENRVLKQERDFLKKAAAFFARENGTR
jgi:transposase